MESDQIALRWQRLIAECRSARAFASVTIDASQFAPTIATPGFEAEMSICPRHRPGQSVCTRLGMSRSRNCKDWGKRVLGCGQTLRWPLKARGRLVSLRTHAVRESEIELYFRRAHAGSAVSRLRALSLVLVEPLSTHRFWNMPPSWEGGCCCRDPRSWARQRDGIRRQGYGVSQRSSVGSARGYRQTTNQGHHKPTYSPGPFSPHSANPIAKMLPSRPSAG